MNYLQYIFIKLIKLLINIKLSNIFINKFYFIKYKILIIILKIIILYL